MDFYENDDFYMTLNLEKREITQDYCVNLTSPLKINSGEKVSVSLCELSYVNESKTFYNTERAVIDVALPSLTGRQKSSTSKPLFHSPMELDSEDPSFDDPQSPLTPPDPPSKPDPKFIKCQLENSENDGSSLCEALNTELSHKLPSSFRKRQIFFKFNELINRVELSLDGSEMTKEDDRATLVIYYPLSLYLGLTKTEARNQTFCFVSNSMKLII